MEQTDLSRSIQATFDSPGTEPGWVPVPDLLAVLDGLQNAMTIVMEDLWGRAHTRGRVPADIQRPATLRLGNVRAGSFVATLQLVPPPPEQREIFDMQPNAVDRLMGGIAAHAEGRLAELPMEALRHIEAVTARIRRTEDNLVLEGGRDRRRVVLSAATAISQELLATPVGPRKVRVNGRLLEIDYKDRSAEVWDPQGRMTRFRFNEGQRAMVDAARQRHVTVEGAIEVGPSGRAGLVTLESVKSSVRDDSFWSSQTLAQLAAQQGVHPIDDPASLSASFWEEDDPDEFLAALRGWR